MGRKGDVYENARRRERVVVLETGADTDGERLVMALTQLPTPVRMPQHAHPFQTETFRITAGALTYVLGNAAPQVAHAGEVVTVKPGVAHVWWNDGPATVEMVGAIEPAGRWLEFMETIYGLMEDGKVGSSGIPNPLQMAVIAWEFRRDWVPTRVPAAVRTLVLPVIAAFGRALGYRPVYKRNGRRDQAIASV